MVLGLGAVYVTFTATAEVGLELALVALTLGIWAMVRIRASHGQLVGIWFAVAGMVSPLIAAGYFVLQLAVLWWLIHYLSPPLSPHS